MRALQQKIKRLEEENLGLREGLSQVQNRAQLVHKRQKAELERNREERKRESADKREREDALKKQYSNEAAHRRKIMNENKELK